MRRVVLNIDRLVLRGVRVDDYPSFAAGLRGELARLLENSTTPGSIRATEEGARARPTKIQIQRGASAGSVGESLARGIAGALRK